VLKIKEWLAHQVVNWSAMAKTVAGYQDPVLQPADRRRLVGDRLKNTDSRSFGLNGVGFINGDSSY